MKKLFIFILFLFTILPTFQTNAFTVKAGDEVEVTEAVNDDFYVAGGRITLNAPINGDLVVAGGELNIKSSVADDLLIAGGDITISGNVGDDIRVAGGTVRIKGNIAGDLIIGAGDVMVDSGVTVGGDLVVGAGRVLVDGNILGKADVSAGSFTLNGTISKDAKLEVEDFNNPLKTGAILGNLEYKNSVKIPKLESVVKGKIDYKVPVISKETKDNIIGFISTYLIIKIIGLFVFASLIYLYFEKLFSSISDNLRTKTGRSFLYGLAIIAGIPAIMILLCISVIGIPFAVLLFFAYIFIFVFLEIINVMVISSLLINKYKTDKLYKKLLIIFGFTLLFGLTNGLNPIVGMFTLGAISIKKFEVIKSLRE